MVRRELEKWPAQYIARYADRFRPEWFRISRCRIAPIAEKRTRTNWRPVGRIVDLRAVHPVPGVALLHRLPRDRLSPLVEELSRRFRRQRVGHRQEPPCRHRLDARLCAEVRRDCARAGAAEYSGET
ncbi:MAG: hypothetical protein IPJ48_03670 [Propionivibrio sp.]|uniref:Uncharacterized protein n=1 Tax=Candidatus Propionivibrio dominans TaxID=2954373 RepID=A0A9D7I7M2_9RHOO|nr:hypothetical protein [Candidatus Propionivibrio dominans]